MMPEKVNPETFNKVNFAVEAWILTGPGKPPDLFLFTEDASVASYLLIYFRGFILLIIPEYHYAIIAMIA